MLRRHQRDAVIAGIRAVESGLNPCIVHATGTGKSVSMAVLSEVFLKRTRSGRVLVTTIREELVEQLKNSFLRFVPRLLPHQIGIEQGNRRASLEQQIVIASIDSLSDKRLSQMGSFDLINIDEAHRSPLGIQRVFDAHPQARRVGWTATPDRLDGLPLSTFFDTLAHVYELDQAIKDGVLSLLAFERVVIDWMDFDQVSEGSDEDQEAAYMQERVLAVTRQAIEEKCAELSSLIFTTSVAHAQVLAGILGEKARAVWGEMPGRRGAIDDFLDRKYPWLLCRDLLTFGFDVPFLDSVVVARATQAGAPHSRALYSQIVGRVTRLYPGKERGLVIDVVGATRRHALITPEEVLQWPESMGLERRELAVSTLDVLKEVQEAEQAMEHPPAMDLSRLQRVQLGYEQVDPMLAIMGIHLSLKQIEERNATSAQIAALEKAGVQGAALFSFAQAQEMFEELSVRRAAGRCTIKQARVLASFGLNPNAQFSNANWAIDRIRNTGWKKMPKGNVPPDLIYKGSAPLLMKENA